MDHTRLVGIYLAAGRSSRMGCSKLNLPLGNRFVGSMAFQAALDSKLEAVIAVTRKEDSLHWLAPFSEVLGWRLIDCDQADRGLSASLKAGVSAASQLGASGVVVLLADQPNVTYWMINRLIEEFLGAPDYSYIAYTHNGVSKPPILITKRIFSLIEDLEGDQGAREIIRGRESETGKQILLESNECFFDVDTMEDYQFVKKMWQNIR
ncbi:nucleotidyltransferase family protein [Neobacillus drentensis]|jgi:molybdenum cofactor cytidylyltransferase|uniref:nucleotidyltransferase family protein n=1 Tax=Neobacillus drentensis TaxID=220684 RepID=UPI002FFD926B